MPETKIEGSGAHLRDAMLDKRNILEKGKPQSVTSYVRTIRERKSRFHTIK